MSIKRKSFIKNIVRVSLMLLTTLSCLTVANEPFWQHKDWNMEAIDSTTYRYWTHGEIVEGNYLELLVDQTNCSNGSILLSIATYEPGLSEYEGHSLNITVDVDGESTTLVSATVEDVLSFTSKMDIVILSAGEIADHLLRDLKRGSYVTFTIDGPTNISDKFDVKSEKFSLSGFTAHFLKASDSCHKGKRVRNAYAAGNFQNILEDLLPLAEDGNAEAQHYLGYTYEKGNGVEQSYNDAAHWYALAAENGNEAGRHNLGVLYQNGWGVPLNLSYAANLHEIAAKRGFAPSQYSLGRSYSMGRGVDKDNHQALVWASIAVLNGHQKARSFLGYLSTDITVDEATTIREMAIQCMESNYEDC